MVQIEWQRGRSGWKGVTWHRRARKFLVQARIAGRMERFGYYDRAEDAALVYDAAVIQFRQGRGFLNLLPS